MNSGVCEGLFFHFFNRLMCFFLVASSTVPVHQNLQELKNLTCLSTSNCQQISKPSVYTVSCMQKNSLKFNSNGITNFITETE